MNIHGPPKYPYFPALISTNISEKKSNGGNWRGEGVISILSLRPQFKEASFVFLTELASNARMNSSGEETVCRLGLVLGKFELNSSLQNKRYPVQVPAAAAALPEPCAALGAPVSITEPELAKTPRENTTQGKRVRHVSLASF